MRELNVTSIYGNFNGLLKIEMLGWHMQDRFHSAKVRFTLQIKKGSYSKTYTKYVMIPEGESYFHHLEEFISQLKQPHMVRLLLHEVGREDQLREGYYRAMERVGS